MSRWPVCLALLGCLASPVSDAADSLECVLAKAGWTSQRESGDLKAAARSFTTLARDCHAAMRGEVGRATPSFLQQLRGPDLRESRGAVLDALFAGGYRYGNGEQPGSWWVELIAHRLEKKDLDGARAVLAKVDAFESLISMQVDRRFDELRKASPELFDLSAAVRRQLARLRARVDATPRSLGARCALAWRLIEVGRHPDGLALMDSALAAGALMFDDWKEQYSWALSARGFALSASGQHPDALTAFSQAVAAAHYKEDFQKFATNLALVLVRLGRPDEALTSLRNLGETSDFGALLSSSVYQRAYLLNGDIARAEAALLRVRANEAAKPGIYLEALLRAGKLGDARDYLLQRLRDPDRRPEALLDAQTWRNPPLTPEQRPVATRKQQLLALPEVRKAIEEVGRIESFDFPEP
jgi:tetratricopeptide (TPR) repeat protein